MPVRTIRNDQVARRVEEFRKKRDWKQLFSELCFCVLTANGSAEKGIKIQKEVGAEGFLTLNERDLSRRLKELGHRFPNSRAGYIVHNRKLANALPRVYRMSPENAREWLVNNFKGIGYKEASHFLRNIGVFDLAILDKHVLRWMKREGLLNEVPKTLTRKRYLEIEEIFVREAKKRGLAPGVFDLFVWAEMTGRVLK